MELKNIIRKYLLEELEDNSQSLLDKKREELSNMEFEHSEILQRVESLKKEIDILERKTSPKIYTAIVKHHTTKEPYIIARSVFRRGKNNYVQLSVYVGKLKDFGNDKDSPDAIKVGERKIKEKIKSLD